MVEQQGVAGGAGLFLNARRGLGAAPGQNGVIEAEAARPAANLGRFGPRVRPQPMIDSGGVERDAAPYVAPAQRKAHQSQGISSARYGDQQAGQVLEAGEQPVGREIVGRRQQEAFFASRSAASFSAGEALGYLRGISEKKAQACSLAPRALSETPSLTMA